MSKRIRFAEREWVSYIAVIGEKETTSDNLQIRDRASGNIRNMTLQELIEEVQGKTEGKPFQHLPLPTKLSRRPQFPN